MDLRRARRARRRRRASRCATRRRAGQRVGVRAAERRRLRGRRPRADAPRRGAGADQHAPGRSPRSTGSAPTPSWRHCSTKRQLELLEDCTRPRRRASASSTSQRAAQRHLHLGHDRPAQRRHPHLRQPLVERRRLGAEPRHCCRRPLAGLPAAVSRRRPVDPAAQRDLRHRRRVVHARFDAGRGQPRHRRASGSASSRS